MNNTQRPGPKRFSSVTIPYLREWRMYRTLTQLDLARAAKVTNLTISKLEGGNRARFHTVRALAAALDIDVDDLRYRMPPAA